MSEKKEYIERGAFIDFIDAGHLRYATEKVFSENDLVKMISERPAADVEPVVRCKDCKWYETGVCDFLGAVTLDDDYCSIGVRTERSGSGE